MVHHNEYCNLNGTCAASVRNAEVSYGVAEALGGRLWAAPSGEKTACYALRLVWNFKYTGELFEYIGVRAGYYLQEEVCGTSLWNKKQGCE